MIPYELIGQMTVIGAATFLMGVLLLVVYVVAKAAWQRLWTFVINTAWGGYSVVNGERPPRWRREIALVGWAMKYFKRPSQFHEKRKKVFRDSDESILVKRDE